MFLILINQQLHFLFDKNCFATASNIWNKLEPFTMYTINQLTRKLTNHSKLIWDIRGVFKIKLKNLNNFLTYENRETFTIYVCF